MYLLTFLPMLCLFQMMETHHHHHHSSISPPSSSPIPPSNHQAIHQHHHTSSPPPSPPSSPPNNRTLRQDELRLAIITGNITGVNRMLSTGYAYANMLDSTNQWPLWITLRYGKPGMQKLLLKNGASATVVQGHNTILNRCAELNDAISMRNLVNYEDNRYNSKRGVQHVLANSTGPYGINPLQIAAMNDFPYIVEILIDCGWPVEAVDDFKNTALGYATLALADQSTMVLLKRGAKPTNGVVFDKPLMPRSVRINGLLTTYDLLYKNSPSGNRRKLLAEKETQESEVRMDQENSKELFAKILLTRLAYKINANREDLLKFLHRNYCPKFN